MIAAVIRKELRGYFHSAIAVAFLGAFIAVTLYAFFWREQFFARGLADVRPLFEQLPRVLIIVVAALAMRQWSDERRTGTLELLLTMPVPRWQLVVGKFAAGMALIALALALTLALPITVAILGPLDVGPVIAGYLAALLVAAAYLAVGMCISAATDNQIIAFVATALACAAMYAVGEVGGAVGRAIGTGARFASIARGVLDARDLAYYAGIVATGLALNLALVTTSRRRLAAVATAALVAANAIALDLWLAPITRARVDLTADRAYSLSPATAHVLASLDEPLTLVAYVSARSQPQLVSPLRDLLDEYRIAGGGRVRIEVVDPDDSDAAKLDASDRFGIEPVPLRIADANGKSIVNAYFAIGVAYGDQHAQVSREQLVAQHTRDGGDTGAELGNVEYELTKTIKKAIADFASVDALFATTTEPIAVTAALPAALPDHWRELPAALAEVAAQLKQQAHGKLAYAQVAANAGEPHLEVKVGERTVQIAIPDHAGQEQLHRAIVDGIERAAPGFHRVVGLWAPPAPPPVQPGPGEMPKPVPPPQTFRALLAKLAGSYDLRPEPLDHPVDDDVGSLVIAGPAHLGAEQVAYVERYVARGGALVILDGGFRLAPGDGIHVERVHSGLEPMLARWGITVGDKLVMDDHSLALPLPNDAGNVHEVRQMAYPFFVKLDRDELSADSAITGSLATGAMAWSVAVAETAGSPTGSDARVVDEIVRSSEASWITTSTQVQPDPVRFADTGFATRAASDRRGPVALAVTVAGALPLAAGGTSPPDTRVCVFGSSAFASDDVLGLIAELDAGAASADLALVHNAVDWSLADNDLLAIRGRRDAARTIALAPAAAQGWRIANVAIAFGALALIVVVGWLRRRAMKSVVEAAP